MRRNNRERRGTDSSYYWPAPGVEGPVPPEPARDPALPIRAAVEGGLEGDPDLEPAVVRGKPADENRREQIGVARRPGQLAGLAKGQQIRPREELGHRAGPLVQDVPREVGNDQRGNARRLVARAAEQEVAGWRGASVNGEVIAPTPRPLLKDSRKDPELEHAVAETEDLAPIQGPGELLVLEPPARGEIAQIFRVPRDLPLDQTHQHNRPEQAPAGGRVPGTPR